MSDIRNKVLLYRTNTSGVSAPADSIVYGELVMNYNADTPFLMFKDTNNEIVKIGAMLNQLGDSEFHTVSQKGITDAFKLPEDYVSVEYPEVDSTSFTKTESGAVIYDAIKNIDQNVAILVQEVLDDEEVISKAITSLNESAGFNENCEYITPLESSIISGATSLYEADLLLGNRIENIENSLSEIEVGISDNYISTEYPNGNFESVSSGDSLDEAIKKIENNLVDVIGELENSGKIDNVKFNNVEGVIENKIVNLEVNAKDISLTDTYESVVYPTITDGSVVFDAVSPSSTIEDAIKQVDETIAKLVDEVIKDEKVVAAAITKINESAGFDINCEYIPNEESEILSAATSLSEADNLLYNAINDLSEEINDVKDLINNIETLSNININEKEGTIENGIASLTLDGSEIKLSNSYESIVYPEIDDDVIFTAVTSEQTVDEAIKTLDNSIAQLVNEVLKDEQVISNTLTVHNDSSGFDLNGKYVINGDAHYIYDVCNLSQADNMLDSAIYELSAATSGLSSNLTNQVSTLQSNVDSLSNTVSNNTSQISNIQSQITNITTDINVNGVASTTVNKVATVTISGSNIPLSTAYSSVEYPDTVTAEFTAVTNNMTVEQSIKQLDTTIAQLVNEVIKDEKVIAAAMMKQNTSCGFDEDASYSPHESSSIIGTATSLHEADKMISDKLEVVSNAVINSINGVKVNGINGELNDIKVAELSLGAKDINLSETYVSVEYPLVSSTEFNAVSASETIENAINKLDTSIAQLVQEVLDDEEVMSSVMTIHNESCGFNENGEYIKSEESNYISNASNLYEADIILDNKVKEIEDSLSSINVAIELNEEYSPITYNQVGNGDNDPQVAMTSNAVGNSLETIVMTLETNINLLAEEINENEFVAAEALTNLNTRVSELENDMTNVKAQIQDILSRLSALEG